MIYDMMRYNMIVVKEMISNKVAGVTLANLLKDILYNYFSKILTKGSEELHFRIAFCSTPTFAEYHPTIASKAKYDTVIHNSASFSSYELMKKCFSSHEKIQFIRILATKTLFNRKN